MMLPNRSAHYECFRHETCCSELCTIIAKFWAKTTSHRHCSEDIDDVQRRSRFAQKGHNWWRIVGVCHSIETKGQSSQWKRPEEPRLKKKHAKFSQMYRFCSPFSSITMAWYIIEVMRQLREAIRQKRTELWKNQSRILRHDNARAYTSMLVREFLAKNKTVIMPQSTYSPNLAPADCFLFQKLKTPMKGKRLKR